MTAKSTATNTAQPKTNAPKRTRRAVAVKPAEVVESHEWQLTRTRPGVLAAVVRPVTFDALNKSHREAFAHFLVNQKWPEGVRFIEEHPFTSAVTTATQKMVEYALRNEITAVLATNRALNKATKTSKVQNEA